MIFKFFLYSLIVYNIFYRTLFGCTSIVCTPIILWYGTTNHNTALAALLAYQAATNSSCRSSCTPKRMSAPHPEVIDLLSSDDEEKVGKKKKKESAVKAAAPLRNPYTKAPPSASTTTAPPPKRQRRTPTNRVPAAAAAAAAAAVASSHEPSFVLEEDLAQLHENENDNYDLAAFRRQQQQQQQQASLLFTDPAFPCQPTSIRGPKKETGGIDEIKPPACRTCRKNMTMRFNRTQQPVYQCCRNSVPALTAQRLHWYRFGPHTGHVLVRDGGSFRAQDLQQGKVGDCWWLSALAVVAERPDLIQRLFPQTTLATDGVVQVRLFLDGYWTIVTIDNFLPCLIDPAQEQDLQAALQASLGGRSDAFGGPWTTTTNNNNNNASSSRDPFALADASRSVLQETNHYLERKCLSLTGRPLRSTAHRPLTRTVTSQDLAYSKAARQQLWVPFLEKAYAKAHGCYQGISGGYIAEAFLDLTGAPTAVHVLHAPGFRPRIFWQDLLRYRRQGLPMGCGTQSSAAGIIGMHAYSILDVREIRNVDFQFFQQTGVAHGNVSGFTEFDGIVRLLRIRNPHGKGEWKGDFSDRSDTWIKLMEHCGEANLERTMRNDGTFWIDYDNFLMAFYNVDVVLAFRGNHGRSFASNFPAKTSNHRCTRAFEVSLVEDQPGVTNNDTVELYCMGIQKNKRGSKSGRIDRKVSYKVSDLGMLVGQGQDENGYFTRVSGQIFGFNRNGHQRLVLDRNKVARLVVMPISFGHPAATDKELPFVVRFVSDAPLMIRELEQVPRLDVVLEQYCLSPRSSPTGQGVQKVVLQVDNLFRVIQVDCRANGGGTVFLYLSVNDEVAKEGGFSLSIEATCRGMSCRTVDGLLTHETIAKGKKFEAAWRRYSTECLNETKSRLLLVLFQSGQDTEFGAITCQRIESSRRLWGSGTTTLDNFVQASTVDKYVTRGIFNAHPASHAYSRYLEKIGDHGKNDVLDQTLVASRGDDDLVLQEALQKSISETGISDEAMLQRALAESRESQSKPHDGFDSDLQKALELSRSEVQKDKKSNQSTYIGEHRASGLTKNSPGPVVDLTNELDASGNAEDKKPALLAEKRRLAAEAAMKRRSNGLKFPSLHMLTILKMVLLIHGLSPVSATQEVPQLWPMPQKVSFHNDDSHVLRTVNLADGFDFDYMKFSFDDHDVKNILQQAQSRFLTTLLRNIPRDAKQRPINPEHKSIWTLEGIHINVITEDRVLRHGIDESYRLQVRPPIDNDAYMLLEAPTVYGILHGLTTLAQLLSFGWLDKSGAPVYRVLGAPLDIADFPAYPYRGLLIDSSRHYLPVDLILKNLDAMAWSKLNVFHWHIVDSQSWPYQSKIFPELSRQGAYCANCVYTPSQVALVVREAALRGIRVVPEFDLPGHSQAIGASHPELLTWCDGRRNEPLDVTKPEVYPFVFKLYDEINATFLDDWIHIGGDEVNMQCWQENAAIQKWKKAHNMTTEEEVLQYFESGLLEYIRQRISKRPVAWQELFDSGLDIPRTVVVDVWKSWMRQETITNATAKGFTVIVSSCWYLDHLDVDIAGFYDCDPMQYLETDAQRNLVAGGHASMWGEHVEDTNFFPRVYPRASAVGEKLWTGESSLARSTYIDRLDHFHCFMIAQGIPVSPVQPGSCFERNPQKSLDASTEK